MRASGQGRLAGRERSAGPRRYGPGRVARGAREFLAAAVHEIEQAQERFLKDEEYSARDQEEGRETVCDVHEAILSGSRGLENVSTGTTAPVS